MLAKEVPSTRGWDENAGVADDLAEIESAVESFFAAFRSGPDAAASAAVLRTLLLPEAVIVRTCGLTPAVYDVETFISPRVELLSSGRLRDFREWPTERRVDLFGDIAQVWCRYEKTWLEDDVPQEGRGMKSMQFVRTANGWRIAAAVWDDERPGLAMPPGA